jgi:hypothetical protein
MPEVQALMKCAKEKINQSFVVQSKKSLLKKIITIIERRWEKQMDHPLYGVAMYLNPGKLHPLIRNDDDAIVGQLRGCFLDVLARTVDDEETRDKINSQSMDYEFLRGPAFSNNMAKDNLQTMTPRKCLWLLLVYYLLVVASSLLNCCVVIAVEWWRLYGGRAIELQRFARRLVSLCSSGCERNWSAFEFVSYYVCLLKSSSTYLATFITNISGLNDQVFSLFLFCRSIQRKETDCCIRG